MIPSVTERLNDREVCYRRNLRLSKQEIDDIESMYDGKTILDASALLIANLDAALYQARASGFFRCHSCKRPYTYPSTGPRCVYCGEPKIGESVHLREYPFKMFIAVQVRHHGDGVILFGDTKPVGLVVWVERSIPAHMMYSMVNPRETFKTSCR